MSDIDEQTFESSVAELALTMLRSKAPSLVDYLMGFQLVDRGDDDTRAAGFFGLKVGKVWVYVPAIFLNGKIKGLEMLYVKEQDVMLPLTDGWVSYLIQRKPFVLGEKGEKGPKGRGGFSLDKLRNPPTSKVAADGLVIYPPEAPADWAAGWEQMLQVKHAASLPKFLSDHQLTGSYLQLMKKNQKVAHATLSFYSLADFKQEKRASGGGYAPQPEVPEIKVRVLDRRTVEEDGTAAFLTDEEKTKLISGQVIVDDRRTDSRKAYPLEVTRELQNPTEPGLYDMLNAAGEFTKVFILMPSIVGGGATRDLRVIVDPTNSDYQLAWATQVWTSKQYTKKELADELADLGTDLDGKVTANSSTYYLVVDGSGAVALGPFTVDQVLKDVNGGRRLVVRQVQPYMESRPADEKLDRGTNLPFEGPLYSADGEIDLNENGRNQYVLPRNHGRSLLLVSDKPIGRIVHGDGASMVSTQSAARLVKLGDPMTELRSMGTVADLHMRIGKYAESVKLLSDGCSLNIVSDAIDRTIPVSNVKRAMETLVCDLNIDSDCARDMLKTAEDRRMTSCRYFVPREKQASPFDKLEPSGTDSWSGARTQDATLNEIIEQLSEYQSPTDNEGLYESQPGDNDAFQQYYQSDMEDMDKAVQSGQKDVFDAAALGSLISADDISGMIDEYVPNLISALDKLGRTLFLLYWHADELTERYGKQEIQSIEDDVKSVFTKLGDVVLSLKSQSPGDEDFLQGSFT